MFASKVFVIAAFCLTATLASTSFKPCASGPAPIKLRVQGCTAEPCILHRGTTVEAEWDFKAVADTGDLRPKVMTTVFDETHPYTLPEQNACKSLKNGKCPLHKGDQVTYSLKMPIHNSYPKVGLGLQFSIVDSKNNVHVCFHLQAKVADK